MDALKALLKKLGATDEDIATVIDDAEADKAVAIDGLVRKNKQLLDKLHNVKDGDNSKTVELESKLEELTDLLNTSKRDFEKQVKLLTKEKDEATTSSTSEKAFVEKLLLDNGLTDALTGAGVRKELIPAARALLKEKGVLSVKTEGDLRKAIAKLSVSGKEQELELSEYVTKHFAVSDEGKAFILATSNSGGSANGGGRSDRPTDMASLVAEHKKALTERRVDDALAIKSKMQELQRLQP